MFNVRDMQTFFLKIKKQAERQQDEGGAHFSYRIVESSEEVNLILEGVYLCLQVNLVQVGTIYILQIGGKKIHWVGVQSKGKKTKQ